jgi:ABC-2 type transport system ATP-binding protein
MLIPSGGCARSRGLDCHAERAELKRHVGYLPDNPVFKDYLRDVEILRFLGQIPGSKAATWIPGSTRSCTATGSPAPRTGSP